MSPGQVIVGWPVLFERFARTLLSTRNSTGGCKFVFAAESVGINLRSVPGFPYGDWVMDDSFQVPADVFRDYLEQRLLGGPEVSSERLEELELACACVQRLPGAAEAFTGRFHPSLLKVLVRTCRDPALAADAAQRTLIHTLLGCDGIRPAISDYSGRGPLGHWLGVVGMRIAQTAMETAASQRKLDKEATGELGARWRPESALQGWDRRHLAAALELATKGLTIRDRAVLRLNVLEGLNIEEIGRLYGVHRGTVARWLAASKALLFVAVRTNLQAGLGLLDIDVESLLRLADSELDVSLSRILM